MGQLFHTCYLRAWYSLWALFGLAAGSQGVLAGNNAPVDQTQQQNQPLLLVCVQYEFAIQITPSRSEDCHWIMLPGGYEYPATVWSQFFSHQRFQREPGHLLRAALLESHHTKKWEAGLLPLPALMFLRFQMPEDGRQNFLPENQTSLSWRYRKETGMTAPYFSGNYIDKPFRRVGMRFTLDY